MIILGIDPGTATTGWGIIQITDSPPAGSPREAGKVGRGRQKANKTKKGSPLTANCLLNLVGFGCILTVPENSMGERLLILSHSLKKIIKEHNPDCVVIEKLFFGSNSTSAISVGQARGVVMLAASEKKLPIFEYTGLEAKLSVAGHGRADKNTVQKAVRRHLKVHKLPKPKDQTGRDVFRFRDDAYDAVAAAICHVLKSDVRLRS